MAYFHGLFSSVEDLLHEFEITADEIKDLEILYASYTYEDYSGSAFVLVRSNITKELFEVHGGHCSCNGIEGQWRLEPTTVKALLARPNVIPHVKELVRYANFL
jgi:hypothetical protein